MLGCDGFSQRAINLYAQVLGEEVAEQFFWRLLIDVVDLSRAEFRTLSFRAFGGAQASSGVHCRFLRSLLLFFRHLFGKAYRLFADLADGKNLLDNQPLRDHRFEFVEDDIDRIDLFAAISPDHALGPCGGLRELKLVQDTNVLADNLDFPGAFRIFRREIDRFRIFNETRRLQLCRRKSAPEEIAALTANSF